MAHHRAGMRRIGILRFRSVEVSVLVEPCSENLNVTCGIVGTCTGTLDCRLPDDAAVPAVTNEKFLQQECADLELVKLALRDLTKWHYKPGEDGQLRT